MDSYAVRELICEFVASDFASAAALPSTVSTTNLSSLHWHPTDFRYKFTVRYVWSAAEATMTTIAILCRVLLTWIAIDSYFACTIECSSPTV